MQNKKLFSVAIIAVLTLSMLAFAAPALALNANPTLSATSGAPGTKIDVSGAAGAADPFSTINVYWDTLGTSLATGYADADGSYLIRNVVIPAATVTAGSTHHYIIVNDGAASGVKYAEFTVIPKIVVSTTPKTSDATYDAKVLPGDSLTITGSGFAGTTSTTTVTVALKLVKGAVETPLVATINTNGTGSFTATVTIPNTIAVADYGAYTIVATDSATHTDDAPILINYYATTTPESGPAGISVTIAGRAPASTAYIITISGPGVAATQIATGTTAATGAYSNTYAVPTLMAANPYQIKVDWVTSFSIADFVISAAPTMALNPITGEAGLEVTVTGTNFVPGANMTISFGSTVVNSTTSDSRFGKSAGSSAATPGSVNNKFSVPALSPGTYTVTLSDQYGASATATFKINAAAVITINTASAFVQGDAIAFTISTTDPNFANPVVKIVDPAGNVYWTATWPVTANTPVDGTFQVIYQDQKVNGEAIYLPANAPTGTWNWTVTFTSSLGAGQKETGLFTVSAAGNNAVISKLDTLQTSISNIQGNLTAISGDVAVIKTSVGTSLAASVTSLGAQITSVQNSIATISAPNLGSINTALSNLDAKVTALQTDSATVKTSLGTINTSLDSLCTSFTTVSDNVVMISTSIGSISGNVTSVKDGVATIQTSLGTVQTGVNSIQGDVTGLKSSISGVQADANSAAAASNNLSPLIIVAIVLALIAAIAAIASIVLMRRKIAG